MDFNNHTDVACLYENYRDTHHVACGKNAKERLVALRPLPFRYYVENTAGRGLYFVIRDNAGKIIWFMGVPPDGGFSYSPVTDFKNIQSIEIEDRMP